MQGDIRNMTMSILERFVVLLYDRMSDATEVNIPGKKIFRKSPEDWRTYHQRRQHFSNTSDWPAPSQHLESGLKPWSGSSKSSELGLAKQQHGVAPLWTTLPEGSHSCHELIHCGCKKGWTGRYKCVKAVFKCTVLCSCSGDCHQ